MGHEKDGGSGSLAKRPKFFKVLMQDPLLNLRIPRKFHTHLPSRLPKMATLLCPHSMSWDVQIHQSSLDIFFQKGWPEFIKAHDLRTGYFLAFQYNGNMNFEVEVFDTTCCLKDYPHKHCTRVAPPIIEIEKYSDSDEALSDESDGETCGSDKSISKETNSSICEVQRVANKQNNFQREQIEGTSCRRSIYIKIEESSESEDTKNCKQSREIPIDFVQKRRKLSNSNDKEKELFQKDPRVIQMEAQRKKIIKSTHSSTSSSQFEKILTPSMIRDNIINIPKPFCVKNDLITNRTIFLKRKIEGEVIPNEWRVGFFFGPTENRIRSGWKIFSKENNLKIGERCIFQLTSKDTFLVQTVPKNHTKEDQNTRSVISKNKVPHPDFESTTSHSTKIGFSTIPKMQSKKNRRSGMQNTIYEKGAEISITVRQYHLSFKYMSLPLQFCRSNNLISRREMVLRGSDGKEWHLIFFLNRSKEGRFMGAGWRKFASEHELQAGDKCLFKIVAEELVLVQVVKSNHEE